MTFGRQGAAGAREGERQVLVPLAPRTLQILTRTARYSWTHAIAAEDVLDERRVSITFRHSPLRPYTSGASD
ncbi:hypothetical protein TSOC_006221 [Tetrabaena socialis]|uniref:Alpha-ketoglutarate-dependent dioxygenase AlkB-like domain-containing protein n=1 Tax=Tetrabaena socialis TaxID=47790 RepID=A0A2J8A485_9CHLO|nr:hypothetical protein TSOC_006221 [Tetrabaena socialis]|eukprot:PNH07326.1 hypothetical protein TSOC_006221 [Tetrabaena socialis]